MLLISHDRDFLDRLVSGVIVPEGDGRWVEYAGGYSDMLAQRGADLAREEPQAGARAKRSVKDYFADRRRGAAAKRRLAFKDKHALETLPQTIATLQSEAGALQARLEEPDFYARDRIGFEQTTAALGELHARSRPRRTNGWSLKCCAKKSPVSAIRRDDGFPSPFSAAHDKKRPHPPPTISAAFGIPACFGSRISFSTAGAAAFSTAPA